MNELYIKDQIVRLIAAKPSDLRQLIYKHTGFTGELTPETVTAAVLIGKEPLLADMMKIINDYSGYDDPAADNKKKKSTWDKFKGFWEKATGVILGAGAVVNATNQALNTPSQTEQQEEQVKKDNKTAKYLLIAGAAVIAILLAVIIIKRK